MSTRSPRSTNFRICAKVWRYDGPGGWHFVTLPERPSAVIRALHSTKARPFGSIRVAVTVGRTEWKTSLFPDKRLGSYLVAVKADVRRKEGIEAGDTIVAKLRIL